MSQPARLGYATASPRTWSVGTLVYNRTALLSVFFWMLWGDLCVSVMETVVPRLVPLRLEQLGAGSTMIGFISVSLLAAVELTVNPFISTYSDRFRSRFGRRRPFILICTPILALCLVSVGFADEAAAWLHRSVGTFGLSDAALTITLIGIALAVFQFFNVVVLATYYYMIADVVPQKVIGSFTSLYRVCGAVGGILFMKYLFPLADRYEGHIYIGCAAIYLIAFLLMGWRVKEGAYPPASPLPSDRGAVGVVAHWLRESFSIRFYQKLYCIGLFYYFATMGSTVFQQLFALGDLKLTKQQFGDITAFAGLVALPVFFVMGPLADRFHPLRMGIVGMALMGLTSFASYFFIHGPISFKLWTTINAVTQTVWLGSQISLLPRILPRAQYGQYCSANNTFCAIGKFGGPFLSGAVIELLGSYRFSYLWTALLSAGGIIAVILAYKHWQRLGGDLSYAPPQLVPSVGDGVEVASINDAGEHTRPIDEQPAPASDPNGDRR